MQAELASPVRTLEEAHLDTLFLTARSTRDWQNRQVPEPLLKQLYALMRMGPTAANCQPTRIVFVTSAAARQRLLPLMDAGNREPTSQAPVTAIVGYDLRFYEQLSKVYAHQPDAAPGSTARRRWRAKPRCVMAACRVDISSWQRAHWVWIAGPWAVSMRRAWPRRSFLVSRWK